MAGMLGGLGQPGTDMLPQGPYPETKKASPDIFKTLGISTPREKQAIAQEQMRAQLIEMQKMQYLQAQTQAMQESQRAQAARLGAGFEFPVWMGMQGTDGGGLLEGAVEGFRNARNPRREMEQGILGGAGELDPAALINQEIAEGPDTGTALMRAGKRLAMHAQESKDPELMKLAVATMAQGESMAGERAHEDARTRSANATAASAEADVAGTKAPYQQGELVKGIRQGNDEVTFEYVGKGPDGQHLFREKSRGRSDSPANAGPLSKNDISENENTFRTMLYGARTSFNLINQVINSVEKKAGQTGKTAGVIRGVDEALSLVSGIGSVVSNSFGDGITGGAGQTIERTFDKANFGSFGPLAEEAAKNQSRIKELAYRMAPGFGQSGRELSDRDVQMIIDIVGYTVTDPKKAVSLMRDLKNRMNMGLDSFAQSFSSEKQGIDLVNMREFKDFRTKYGEPNYSESEDNGGASLDNDNTKAGALLRKIRAQRMLGK